MSWLTDLLGNLFSGSAPKSRCISLELSGSIVLPSAVITDVLTYTIEAKDNARAFVAIGQVIFPPAIGGEFRVIQIALNGVPVAVQLTPVSANGSNLMNVSLAFVALTGMTVTLRAEQHTGSPLTLFPENGLTWLKLVALA